MKKSKVLVLFLLGILLVSFFVSVVSAAWNVKDTFFETFSEIFSGGITNAKDFFTKVLAPEILFGLLVFLVIFAIINRISLFKQPWIKITISIIVAILAGGFIDVRILHPILNQYTAIGIIISFYLPFILIFYFLREIAPQNFLISKVVWISYAIIIFINAFANWNRLEKTSLFLYATIIFAAIVMAIFWITIMKKLLINDIQIAVEKAKSMNKIEIGNKIAVAQQALVNIPKLNEKQKELIIEHIKALEKELNR